MNWNFKQELSVRASTWLLIFFPIMYVISRAVFNYSENVPVSITNIIGALGTNFIFIFLASFIFSLAFFIGSIVHKKPQLQYLIEVIASFILFVVFI